MKSTPLKGIVIRTRMFVVSGSISAPRLQENKKLAKDWLLHQKHARAFREF